MDWKGNLENIYQAISDARSQSVDILCLPELSITGYGCEDMFLSEWLPATALEKLATILPWTSGITVTIGLPYRLQHNTYNTIAIVSDQKVVGFYAKHNLANDGVHYEHRWFSSWPYYSVQTIDFLGENVPFGAIDLEIQGVKTGLEICEDAWREDRPACNLVKKGIELILNPSASHFAFGKEEFRENLVIDSSRQFNCVYLYTNLLGNEAGRMIYDGDILIAQQGKLIGHNRRLSFKSFNILHVDVDFGNGDSTTDIREDFANKYEEFGQVVPLALFDYVRKSKSKGFVLSLSGGADSGTIAMMVYRMVMLGIEELGVGPFCHKLGLDLKENAQQILKSFFTTAYQGTVNSSKETREAARYLAEYIGSTHYDWDIDKEIQQYTETVERALERKLSWETDDIALQNIQSRARSPIIWMVANIKNALLLTTSNRSEGDVGYATMDGDTSGSISPIAAVDKYFILKWMQYAEKELGHTGFTKINQLQPTAELRPLEQKQTDEDDLMPYEALVSIEREAIRNRKSPSGVYNVLQERYNDEQLKEWIKKFYQLWSRNQWKRERIAPSFHVDDFNVDPRTWCRFPILSSGFREELDKL
jgi:NAD+ synthase (glutamine-hydrolysing)